MRLRSRRSALSLDDSSMRWLRSLKQALSQRKQPDPTIRRTVEGFTLNDSRSGTAIVSVAWADVATITTYKIDLLTTDCICVLFELRNGQSPVQISEEWEGFTDFMAAMQETFPAIPEDWYVVVMQPAFEPNRRVLFQRQSQAVV
jgi:hypothetical protein